MIKFIIIIKRTSIFERMKPINLFLKSLFGMLYIFAVSFQTVIAQELPAPTREIQIWPGPAPGSETWDWQENTALSGNGLHMVQNVVRPVLLFYPADPALANGTAMIVAPGGGFVNLMMSYEGVDIAQRLNQMGVHAFVLKYRLLHIDPDHPGQRPENQPRGMGWLGKQAGQNILEMASADGQQAGGPTISWTGWKNGCV